jgi:hypothetical protein
VMARSGYAAQSIFPPDVLYEEEVREAARFAREHGYGLWAACVTDAEGDTNDLLAAEEPVAAPDVPPAPVEPVPEPVPEQVIISDPVEAFGCLVSYPDVCIDPASGDLDCDYIYGLGLSHITVYPPDPHGFDGNDNDGLGCEGG